MNTPTDTEIMLGLMHQVRKAMPSGGNEADVVTFVTRPMWRAWCRAVGMPEESKPTEWLGLKTNRIYGSKTIITESDKMASASVANA